MKFSTEKDLFQAALSSSYFMKLAESKKSTTLIEPRGLFGIPDLVITTVDNVVEVPLVINAIAFEMKLCKWQRALIQAYRYRSFAKKSYVVMDHERVKPALRQISRFVQSNVGLLSISSDGEVHTHFDPGEEDPYCSFTHACLEEIMFKDRFTLERTSRIGAIQFPLKLIQAG